MLVDWSRLDSLIQADDEDDKEWLSEMIESLKTNMSSRLTNIVSFSSDQKQSELQAELHQTKGVAANFGLEKLRTTIANAEELLKNGNLTSCHELCSSLGEIWTQTKAELNTKYPGK
ncbi:histidine phosphotransferase [Leptospira perolatii]|uniref:Histidine phosphotransferase n=1 Tax=Leptospira perolatii TaxID=2023191 RepID=A0A2M9ZI39_9LEPT|nr:Hpt domain-containing protein [Leptospira perolatii]PJZ68106.1 histidine phosphotransferase [Leptospira perolatii]PJZ71725.1 histidine phosphotransferase [Leptospira perolatii]